MLNTRARGAAEGKGDCGNQRAARVPATVMEEQQNADPAEKQINECHRVEGAQPNIGVCKGEQNMQR